MDSPSVPTLNFLFWFSTMDWIRELQAEINPYLPKLLLAMVFCYHILCYCCDRPDQGACHWKSYGDIWTLDWRVHCLLSFHGLLLDRSSEDRTVRIQMLEACLVKLQREVSKCLKDSIRAIQSGELKILLQLGLKNQWWLARVLHQGNETFAFLEQLMLVS